MSSPVNFGRNLVSLKWEDFNLFVVSELAALYQKDDLTDVTLFCEGRSFRAHKMLLSLWSDYFKEVFRATSHSHPVVILRETNSSDLEFILRFIYQGQLLIPMEDTDRFLKTAEHFQIAGLKNMRHHIPSFSYTTSSSNNNTPHASAQPAHSSSASDGSGIIINAGSDHRHSSGSEQSISIPKPSNVNTTSLSSVVRPLVMESCPNPTPAMVNQMNVHMVEGTMDNPEQNSHQSSSRSSKHPSSSPNNQSGIMGLQFQSNTQSSQDSGIHGAASGSVRLPSESVIYQSQPVLIFQNGNEPPLLRSSEQYAPPTRTVGGDSEECHTEHAVSSFEGIGGNPSGTPLHIQSASTSGYHSANISHAPANSTNECNPLYRNSSCSPKSGGGHHHHPPPRPDSGKEESILGLPYNVSAINGGHLTEGMMQQQHAVVHEAISHGTHKQQQLGPEVRNPTTGAYDVMECSSAVTTHSYGMASQTFAASRNEHGGSNSTIDPSPKSSRLQKMDSSSNSSNSSSNGSSSEGGDSVHSVPVVYAVKKIPPHIPKESTTTANVGGPPTGRHASMHHKPAGTSDSGTQSTYVPGSSSHRNVRIMSTRSKSASGRAPATSKTTSGGGTESATVGGRKDSSVPTAPTRKVALVPCPKCGKKVKQTSLKVHMKRTHLEEGTVLVCPICSKRISSKGVYYKHMYIHRKKSETDSRVISTSTAAVIKTEHS